MNFSGILNDIEKLDPEVYERTSPRRDLIKNWSRKVALTALPFALGGMFKKAYGQSTANILEVLNYALTLEYLESEFYKAGLSAPGLIPAGAATDAITNISLHEEMHVAFLTKAIQGAGGTPVTLTAANFDFSGGKGAGNGPFAGLFGDYDIFLAVAQTLEDTGVRAYKGGAGALMSNDDILTAALQIHSVEARHAAHIRSMRFARGVEITPWITGIVSGVAGPVAGNYLGEDVTKQLGISIPGINGKDISVQDATEAFDEPLSMDDVLKLVDPFLV